jgi:tetratricopeptide (TPR) repeat protein
VEAGGRSRDASHGQVARSLERSARGRRQVAHLSPRSSLPRGRSAANVAVELPKGALGTRLEEAAAAYAADRYQDALGLLRRLVALLPGSAPVRELLGLTYYRLGRWRLAIRELVAHHELSGSYDQYPVVADCYRALGLYEQVEAAWLELRRASPTAEVVAEGRIVAASALADRGDVAGAVKLLEPALRRSSSKRHDLRQWYVLADLYERAGDLPRAREVFARVCRADPDAYDVGERLAALG